MSEIIENLLGEKVPISEALIEMNSSTKEEVIIIKGKEIPKSIYDLCVNHYLAVQYGDKDL